MEGKMWEVKPTSDRDASQAARFFVVALLRTNGPENENGTALPAVPFDAFPHPLPRVPSLSTSIVYLFAIRTG